MIYLLDTSGLVRLLAGPALPSVWTVLHDDLDYRTVAQHAPDLGEHSVHDVA
ncbi:hypothetical protein ACIP6I_32515 [Streptomyces anulatus]